MCEKIEAEGLTKGLLPAEALEHYEDLVHLQIAAGRPQDAIAASLRLLELAPRNARIHNELAWIMATCQDSKFRDPSRAAELARKAVELAPKEGTFWNTLGVAHFRTGDWNAAIAALTRSMDLRTGGDSNDWFFLAMAHWQKGDKLEARCWYDKAVSWMDKNQSENDELSRFRAEAAALLEVKQKKD